MRSAFQKLEEEGYNVAQKAKNKAQEVSAGIRNKFGGGVRTKDGKQLDFDPDVIPPDVDAALNHRVSKLLNILESDRSRSQRQIRKRYFVSLLCSPR